MPTQLQTANGAKKGSISHFFNNMPPLENQVPNNCAQSLPMSNLLQSSNGAKKGCSAQALTQCDVIPMATQLQSANCNDGMECIGISAESERNRQTELEIPCVDENNCEKREDNPNNSEATNTDNKDDCAFKHDESQNAPNGSNSVKADLDKFNSSTKNDSSDNKTETTPKSAKPVKRGFFATKMLELEQKKKRENQSLKMHSCHSNGKIGNCDNIDFGAKTSAARGTSRTNAEQYTCGTDCGAKAYAAERSNNTEQDVVRYGKNNGYTGAKLNEAHDSNSENKEHAFKCGNDDEPVSKIDGVMVDNTDYSKCDECGRMVSAWDLPEHLDFHFAQKLQKEQQQQPQSTATNSRTPISQGNNSKKRKVDSTKSKTISNKRVKTSSNQQKTLDGFFRRS